MTPYADTTGMDAPLVFGPTVAERERVVEVCKAAVSDGRLTVEEFETRLDAVYAAQSRAQLEQIVASVPAPGSAGVNRHKWVALILVAWLIIAVVGVAALVREQRTISADPNGAHLVTSRGAQPLVPGSETTELPAQCLRSIPFSDSRTALLNRPVALGLPASSEFPKCAAAADLSASSAGPHLAIHVHLDVVLESNTVTVPTGLGVDSASGDRTQIFTDNDQGVVTVDANGSYTLGQLFTEWGHPLTTAAIGNLRMMPDFPVYWFVNGKRVGQAASIRLHNHDEIQGFEDLRGAKIKPTKRYAFPPGY
jgi:Domain of unknown function (DUF1707)